MSARRPGRPLLPVPGAAAAAAEAILLPGAAAGTWELLRPAAASAFPGQVAALASQVFASLDAAALELIPGEAFVLEVPLELGLIQRFVLPLAEPAEVEEMARLQLEKILPYPAETVGLTFAEVARSETEVVLAVEALSHDRLVMLCQPLTSRGCWPARVLFHSRAVAAALGGNAAFICGEAGKFVLGIGEAGCLSFAQALSGAGPAEIAAELPAVLLGAELEGLPTEFPAVRLDGRCEESREALEVSLGVPVEMFDAGAQAVPVGAAAGGDLSPPGWRTERLRLAGQVRLKRRVLAVAAVYVGLLVLGVLTLGFLKIRLLWLDSQLAAIRPGAEAVQTAQVHWKNLAPAIDKDRYVIEILSEVYECLPPNDTIRLTNFRTSPDDLAVKGEAPSPAAAVEFTEKLKVRPGLRKFRLKSEPLTIAPGHVTFGISGKTS